VKALRVVSALVLAAAIGFVTLAAPIVGRQMNPVTSAPRAVSERARSLHASLIVADLHCDALLWGRDLAQRSSWGHVDVPRLVEGRVALEVFAVVTQTPRGLNIERNDASSDNVRWLALAQRWPPRTLGSLLQRALYQADRLHAAARASAGRLSVVTTAAELTAHLRRRQADSSLTAGILALEGSHALEGDVAHLDDLERAGFRIIGLAHFFDNPMAGSAHGVTKGGLTEAGRTLLRRIEEHKLIVDVAHASPRTIEDVLALAQRPVIVSHTGVRGTCNNTRNLSDEQLRAIAGRGGLVGIGFWETAVCGHDAPAIARAIRHAASVAGVEHVALGSDYDGAVGVPFDASRLAELTEALLAQGFSEADVARLMGGNQLAFLERVLP
jgi:membrane dipeptidase